MLRQLYDRVFDLARSRHATKALAVVSFAESSVFPIPPDVMLAPMILARPDRAYFYAGVCTLASVLGGILGYAIGDFLTDLGLAMMRLLGHSDGLAQFRAWFDQWGLWVILIKGLTPIPYKLVTIASGLAHFSFPVFVAASVVTRSGRSKTFRDDRRLSPSDPLVDRLRPGRVAGHAGRGPCVSAVWRA